jgi:3-oxo-5-alpha-steroid 4-dehydrogenase 1
MTQDALFGWLVFGWLVLAGVMFVVLFFIAAPYGRHIRRNWGPTLPSWLGWIIMEAPAALVFFACFALGQYRGALVSIVFVGMWEAHYVHRAFIYPLGLRRSTRRMPIAVMAMGITFNVLNGYLNGYYLFTLSGGYPAAWLLDPRFLAGLMLFVAGFVINRRADRTLRLLRKPGEEGYRIPQGGLYRWVSCPNYLGEIVEWCGWAVATWSLPGLAFAIWTAANLIPRAVANHRWYQTHFPDYPSQRKALLPGIL